MAKKYVQAQAFTLAGSGTIIGATTIVLSSFKTIEGVNLTMTDFGDKGWFTIEAAGGTNEEPGTFTGVTQNANGTATLTGVKHQLALSPYTETSGLTKAHTGGVKLIITNTAGFHSDLATTDNNETITGTYTFTMPVTVPTPVANTDAANKAYVLSVVSGGTVTTSAVTVSGIAGETITKDQLLYLKPADGRWWLVDADDATTCNNVQLGLAQGAGIVAGNIVGGILTEGLAILTAYTVTAGTKYYASNTAGAISTTAGTTEVTIGMVPSGSTTSIYFAPRFDQQITEDIQDALTAGGDYGTPSSTNPYITKSYNSSATGLPVVNVLTANTPIGSSSTQFDITNTAGTTYRYTFDGTGTDPLITAITFPIGTIVDIQAQNFTTANKGLFVLTGSGNNYIEVTNASGVVESNKTIGTGYIVKGAVYTKPAGLKYLTIEQVGAGAAGDGVTASDAGGNGGSSAGYAKKLIATTALASTINYVIGYKTIGTTSSSLNIAGRTVFNHSTPIITTGGTGWATPGTATGGDININGQLGGFSITNTTGADLGGAGANSLLGLGGLPVSGGNGIVATGYGAGGGGSYSTGSTDTAGGNGTDGVIIITEYFS